MDMTEFEGRWEKVNPDKDPEWEKIKADLARPLIEKTLDILAKKGKERENPLPKRS